MKPVSVCRSSTSTTCSLKIIDEGEAIMVSKRLAGVLLLLVTGLFMVASNRVVAQHRGGAAVDNIILVHGAWADGSSWSRVIPLLEARGFHVTAVQLPLTSLADDVATTKRAITRMTAEQPGPILLVGHSYGGVVIGEVGNDPNVVGLVYVAAFAPDYGESALSLLSGLQTPPPVNDHLVRDAEGFFTIDQAGVAEDFAQCLPEVERRVLTSTQGPTSGAALTGTATSPAWKTKPSWFIVAKQDRTIPPALEKMMATRIGATTFTFNSCHVAMLDVPFKVADVIADAARRIGERASTW
jgi:pimeloyl-ACP methyl ester carboxylesterase